MTWIPIQILYVLGHFARNVPCMNYTMSFTFWELLIKPTEKKTVNFGQTIIIVAPVTGPFYMKKSCSGKEGQIKTWYSKVGGGGGGGVGRGGSKDCD